VELLQFVQEATNGIVLRGIVTFYLRGYQRDSTMLIRYILHKRQPTE